MPLVTEYQRFGHFTAYLGDRFVGLGLNILALLFERVVLCLELVDTLSKLRDRSIGFINGASQLDELLILVGTGPLHSR